METKVAKTKVAKAKVAKTTKATNTAIAAIAAIEDTTEAVTVTKNINQDIDLCLLKYINDAVDAGTCDDIDIEEATQAIYDILNNNCSELSIENVRVRVSDIKHYRKELNVLLQLPLMKQRTTEWFEARKTRLTASDLYDAVKGGNVSIRLAKKKANIVVDNINYNAIPALKWGTMFEPMATRCYSQRMNNIAIHDFGLICDTSNEHFGASPDGINELGIMLEIKCPYSRKIEDGIIPDKYRMQIQGQLAVCKLKECDYIECIFKSIENEEDYLELEVDINNNIKHGVIAEFYNQKGEYVYFYSDPNKTPKECVDDITNIRDSIMNCSDNSLSTEKLKFSKYTYWKLDDMIIQRVVFNANEWETIVPKINTFWESVEEYKMLPIEIGIKKYKFVDDSDGEENKDGNP
uniref:YqaJ viral recombinase domain-containing protein n=1 Tax=viral metagenome TaxID=1070528 RepID=A0A6C0LDT9_9ZZZZ